MSQERCVDFSRRSIEKRIKKLRAEMIQWQNDLDHWNRLHPDEQIVFPTDIFTHVTTEIERAKR